MTRGGLAFLLAALAAAAPLARGQESGPYVGGALGESKLKEWCDSTITLSSCDAKDSAWKIFGGYRLNRYIGAEFSYIDWGQTTASTASASVSAEQRSYGLAGVASLQLAPRFAVFGKLGRLETEQETKSPTSSVERSDWEWHYGLGLHVHLWRGLMLRGEWERTDELKVEMLSLGAEYRF